jgi:hypothetical protein
LFARLRLLAQQLELHLKDVDKYHSAFWSQFAARMTDLEKLARKELKAEPFTKEEAAFLKKTIDARGGGSGMPRYDGWYPQLFAGGSPDKWEPVVADVHTDPDSEQALQEAVGDANFLVVAIDNQKDTAVYVGPAYSYYEFRSPLSQRMTNEAWEKLIQQRATWADKLRSYGPQVQNPWPRAAMLVSQRVPGSV